jgi:DNA-binding NarL/FixJ family response regulator
MSRLILVFELVLGVIALSITFSGFSPFFYLVFTPFFLVLLIPCLVTIAVWPFSDIITAGKDAFSRNNLTNVSPKSTKIFRLFEKSSYSGAILGSIAGVSIFLQKIGMTPPEVILKMGKDALLGVSYALIAAVLFNMILSRFSNPKDFSAEPVPGENLDRFARKYSITRREKEIILLITAGKSNKDIAGSLYISEDTVKNHIYNIFQKTEVRNRSELISRILLVS